MLKSKLKTRWFAGALLAMASASAFAAAPTASGTCIAYDTDRSLEIKRVFGLPAGSDCQKVLLAEAGDQTGVVSETLWHPKFAAPTAFSQPGEVTRVHYDEQGRPTHIEVAHTDDPVGAEGLFAHDVAIVASWHFDYPAAESTQDAHTASVAKSVVEKRLAEARGGKMESSAE